MSSDHAERIGMPTKPLQKSEGKGRSPAFRWVLSHPVVTSFFVAVLARWLLTFLSPHLFGGALISADSLGFHGMAEAASVGSTGHWDEFTQGLYGRTGTYLFPLTYVYRIFGASTTVGGLFTGVLGAGTAAAVAWLTRVRLGDGWALAAGLSVALFPSQILWSSSTLKDAAVWFVSVVLAILVSRVVGATSLRGVIFLGLAIATAAMMLLYTRQHVGLIALYAIALTAWIGARKYRYLRVSMFSGLAILLPWAVGLGLAGSTLITDTSPESMRYLRAMDAESAVVEVPGGAFDNARAKTLLDEAADLRAMAAALRESISDENGPEETGQPPEQPPQEKEAIALEERATAIEEEVAAEIAVAQTRTTELILENEGSISADLAHLPKGLAVMLFEPYPWDATTSVQFRLAKFEALVWWPIVLLALVGLKRVFAESRFLLFPVLHGAGTLFVYALTEGNLGTAFRHRGELVWVAALLATFGAYQCLSWIRQRRAAVTRLQTQT